MSDPAVDRSASSPNPWWSNAVIYQVYLRSFFDSDGDGIGDLNGVRQKLDYLQFLGADGFWVTPFFRSPMADHGYDVSDPRDVDPLFGDLAAFDALVTEAHQRNLRVIIDLVPNHSSEEHPWFQEALAAQPGSPARNRYIFHNGRGPNGDEPPNNWPSIFGGSAWTRVPDGQWYLHLFAPEQPDLNWTNPEVAEDFARTLRFWLDRGVDGIRIDVAHGMAKPTVFTDAPLRVFNPLLAGNDADPRFDNPAVHDVHRMIRRVIDSYPDRMAVGEVWVENGAIADYARPDELHQVFNFDLLLEEWNATKMAAGIDEAVAAMTSVNAPPCWALANHDKPRTATRYGGGETSVNRARAAALVLLALPGAACIYYGEELGMSDVDLPDEALQDPMWERSGHTERGRDAARIPLPWQGNQPPYGFSSTVDTWLPMPDDWKSLTVAAQRDDPHSTLSLYRSALELRRTHPAFTGAGIDWLPVPSGGFAFRRTGGGVCILNASDKAIPLPPGEVLLASNHLFDGQLPPDTAAWLV